MDDRVYILIAQLKRVKAEVDRLRKALKKPAKCEVRHLREALRLAVKEQNALRTVVIEYLETN
jgi:hypothetical protein